jgi:hypothetical protein
MDKGNSKKTEDYLATFSLTAVPPGLKGKILEGVLQERNSKDGMTTFLRKGFVGCLLMLIFVIAVDATITRAQNRRFSTFLDKQQESKDKIEEEWSMLMDIIWEPFESTDHIVKKKFYGTQEKSGKKGRLPEWRESLEEEFE